MHIIKIQSTATPEKELTYQEWVDELRTQENVIVSSKYHSRTIEQRIRVDEAIQLKREMETSEEKVSDGTAEPRILFGMLRTVINLF
jgi:predicted secreted Zn-dependent protease